MRLKKSMFTLSKGDSVLIWCSVQCVIVNHHHPSPPATPHVSVFKQPSQTTRTLTCAHGQTSHTLTHTRRHERAQTFPVNLASTLQHTRQTVEQERQLQPILSKHLDKTALDVCSPSLNYTPTLYLYQRISNFSPLICLIWSNWKQDPHCFGALLLFCGQVSVKVSPEKHFQ